MDNLNYIVSKNLSDLRKRNGLTQAELAEKLNYSDKAVSKWEKGESLPGVEVLYKLSKLYGVSLDFIVGEETVKTATAPKARRKYNIITLLSVLAVWLLATVIYIFCKIFAEIKPWLAFCWAVPASFVVTLVFDVIWHRKKLFFLIVSLLMWSLLLCFCLQFLNYNIWIILGIGVPLQAGALLWWRLVK
ncbi:MAG: helix-turn-helix transcriptional regulator [Acutalibacteraceae bacterium]|nr:helix-turn-helix transcriptional regulator [Acutalibacteraceae bacterium]